MKRLVLLPALIAAIALTSSVATASALTTPIGEVAPGTATALCTGGPLDIVPGGPGQPLFRVPAAGVLTSWSTNAAAGAGQMFEFKVYRPLGGNRYLVVGHDGPRPLTPSTVNTFPISIPVQAGDVIGENDANASSVNNACARPVPGEAELYPTTGNGGGPDNSSFETVTGGAYRLNIAATLQPAPTITAITPSGGGLGGGTSVTISGTGFVDVSKVVFGTTAAPFLVVSESTILATSPSAVSPGTVPVTVVTPAGSVISNQLFTYSGVPALAPVVAPPRPALRCRVPDLEGARLKAAKRKIRGRACKVGNVGKRKGVTARSGEVVKQNPKPGATKPAGTKVNVTLG
jgi:hypothetical protein